MAAADDTVALLEAAAAALQADELDVAQAALAQVLAADAQQPDALHFLGILRHRQGRSDEAVALITQALATAGGHAGMHINLGNVLFESGRAREAVAAYETALDGEPASGQAWCNLGTALHGLGDLAQARHAWQQAVHHGPDNAEAWYGLSRCLVELGQVHEGLLANSHAVALWPRQGQAREQVIRALLLLERHDDAERLYREWLAEEPDNAIVHHQLGALRGNAPERASDAYVETVFDSYASVFDGKLAALNYQAPQLVTQALAAFGVAEAALDIADLGCGTGLCGPLLRPFARRLVGCDLSTGMLVQAQRRQCYDALFKVELLHFLQHEPRSFDVLVSADTLCYFGPLDAVCAAAAGALRGRGRFVFTVEALADGGPDWLLRPTGRYAHTRSHLENALRAAGFANTVCSAGALRQEAGLPMAGWVAVATLAELA